MAVGILIVRLVDLFWLIAPEFHHDGIVVSWLDVVLPLSLGSLWLGCFVWQLRGRAILPVHDPQFDEALGRHHRARRAAEDGALAMAEQHRTGATATPTTSAVHHEESDVNIRAIFGFGAGLIVVAVVVYPGRLAAVRLFRQTREAERGPAEYPLAAGQENRLPPEPRLQTKPREDLRELRARKRRCSSSYGWVDKNAGVVRIPIDEAMKLTLRARAAGATAGRTRVTRSYSTTEDTKDTKDSDCCRSATSVSSVSFVCLCVLRAAAGGSPDDRRARRAGYKRSRAWPASALPAPLREIGFDQNLDQHAAARHAASSTKPGATVRLGDYFGTRPVVLAFVVLRLPDAVHAGDQRRWRARSACCRSTPGKDFEIVTVSFDPRETPATAAAKKAVYLRALQAARRRRRLAFPHRRPAVDRAADAGRRLPLRLGRGDEAVRASDRHHRADARRPARALPLRHRVRPARSAPRARRSVGGQGRHRRSTRCCSTAITTTR